MRFTVRYGLRQISRLYLWGMSYRKENVEVTTMRLTDADKFILALMDASLSSVDEDTILDLVDSVPTVDAVVVTRCKDCAHSTLPSELTQRYGKPGTLTCHNMHAPSNRRNVGSNDFCSYGERREDA